MNEELIKDIIKLKLRVGKSVADRLPCGIGVHFTKCSESLLRAMTDAVREHYVNKPEEKVKDKGLQNIGIE